MEFRDILKRASGKRVVISPHDEIMKNLLKQTFGLTEVGEVEEALRLVRQGEADVLVQGNITIPKFFETLEGAGVSRENLCFTVVFEDLVREKLLFVADAYIHDFPSLEGKIGICREVVNFAKLFGIRPKVVALAAIETVNPAIISTVDAAVLSKMSQRGQIDADVEGPLDIDTALSREAAKRKGVDNEVSGDVDVLLCPDIESSFALCHALTRIGNFPAAGILLGAEPIVIHPRFIPAKNKVLEVALSALRH
jgi:phosphate butyryltransferase